jgi:hypothetical protein
MLMVSIYTLPFNVLEPKQTKSAGMIWFLLAYYYYQYSNYLYDLTHLKLFLRYFFEIFFRNINFYLIIVLLWVVYEMTIVFKSVFYCTYYNNGG